MWPAAPVRVTQTCAGHMTTPSEYVEDLEGPGQQMLKPPESIRPRLLLDDPRLFTHGDVDLVEFAPSYPAVAVNPIEYGVQNVGSRLASVLPVIRSRPW